MSLFALIGAVDNLDEPTPLINRRTTIFGLVITSLVLISDPTQIQKDMLTVALDRHLILCQLAAICQIFRNTMPWMGRHSRNITDCRYTLHTGKCDRLTSAKQPTDNNMGY